MTNSNNPLFRIGVFYDGTYFSNVSNFYLHNHERKARLSIEGLHEFIRDEVSRQEGVDRRFCQIVDAHYFRGRMNAKQAQENDLLYRERQFDDVLIREGVTMHYLPLVTDRAGDVGEKGIDVWFALEAYELAIHKRFDISVLVTGDGDFVPLVRKLNTVGTRVMLLAWDFEWEKNGESRGTKTAQSLINEVTYPIMMSDEIDSRGRKKDPSIARLFVQKPVAPMQAADRPMHIEKSATPISTRDTLATNGEMTGVICNFNPEKRYGFIRPDTGADNVFFHFNNSYFNSLDQITPGTPVRFHVAPSDRGPAAMDVSVQ